MILYRALVLGTALCCLPLFSGRISAQADERPQIRPGERKPTKKKDAGPRAIGVLQMTASGKVTLIPIAIQVNGKFYDASAYKADPVPMSLDSGNVYEGVRTGNSLGLFTVNGALHSNSSNVPNPWIGTGSWLPTGTDAPSKGIKAEPAPVGIDTSEGPPRLTKNPEAVHPTAPPASKDAPATKPAPSSSPSSSSDEPPRLSKPKSDSGDSTSSSQSSPAPSDKTGDAKTGKSPDSKTEEAKANVPASDSGTSEANRPRLRRGKPPVSFADEEVPGYSKFGTTSPAGTIKAVSTAAAAPVDLIPAISDASGPDPRSYKFDWIQGEEGDRRQQLTAMAKQQLQAYLAAQAKAQISSVTGSAKGKKAPAKKAPEPVLENIRMIAYDVWNNNIPVIIFSAEAPMPPPSEAMQVDTAALRYSVLLVAYPDTYGNLRKIYSSVTDRFHLDITPRLELVDAVDADGDGRGELLFKEISDAGTGWVIYRPTPDKLWKMFDSLNPD